MKKITPLLAALFTVAMILGSLSACSSGPSSSSAPATNRAGRPIGQVRGMSSHQIDRKTLYDTCLKERDATYCNNRLGR